MRESRFKSRSPFTWSCPLIRPNSIHLPPLRVSHRRSGTEADTVVPDGTKCYSQDDDREYHDVQVILAGDTDEDSRSVLDISVNADWNEIVSSLETIDAITDDARVVSDAENRLVTAFTTETPTST